jgi:exopolysaccharide/PEP-CTERM locus tyrosine autokinase
MVTSSIPGEGKSITSLNLAITMAQELDHSVLLVEADIRKPSLMHYLGLKSDRGLTDCVLDGLDISKVLVKTGIGSLSILPAGRQVDNPVELFSSKRMKALIDEIKTRYNDRYVIVDTTPLLPFAEPTYIANMVGAVIMVVRKGVTPTDKLKSSLEILKDHNLLGVVYNCVSQVNSLHGYYGYYGYHGDR